MTNVHSGVERRCGQADGIGREAAGEEKATASGPRGLRIAFRCDLNRNLFQRRRHRCLAPYSDCRQIVSVSSGFAVAVIVVNAVHVVEVAGIHGERDTESQLRSVRQRSGAVVPIHVENERVRFLV